MIEHHFRHTDQYTYTDQHGHVGVLDDSRQLNGKIYFAWRYQGNKIFEITADEMRRGFSIEERD